MTQTAGVINGTDLRLYVGDTTPITVAYATNCTFDATMETRQTIHKDNPGTGWQEFAAGSKSATLSTDVLMNEDSATNDPYDLFALLSAGTQVSWYFSTEVAGNRRLYGEGLITSFSIAAPVEENATYSVTITVTGEPQVVTLT